MAIDYGDARTGVAISDALGWMTGQTAVIHSWKPEKTAEEVARMFKASGAQRLVMGLPAQYGRHGRPACRALPRLCRASGADSRDKARFVG
ncbi:MAG: Holliday junction resolvase RuvX [Oscillospiraceae bacterium]